MQAIQTYLYSNKIVVQILDTTIFKVRNRQVYSRPIKIYQGIDNPIQVVIKNQDQKAVNFTGYIMQADIQDPVNKVTAESIAAFEPPPEIAPGAPIEPPPPPPMREMSGVGRRL